MDKKILVAYFSANGVTGEAAWKLAVAGKLEGMERYDTVFVGFPIWLAYHNLI